MFVIIIQQTFSPVPQVHIGVRPALEVPAGDRAGAPVACSLPDSPASGSFYSPFLPNSSTKRVLSVCTARHGHQAATRVHFIAIAARHTHFYVYRVREIVSFISA